MKKTSVLHLAYRISEAEKKKVIDQTKKNSDCGYSQNEGEGSRMLCRTRGKIDRGTPAGLETKTQKLWASKRSNRGEHFAEKKKNTVWTRELKKRLKRKNLDSLPRRNAAKRATAAGGKKKKREAGRNRPDTPEGGRNGRVRIKDYR